MAFGFVVVKFSFFIKQLSYLLGKDKTIPGYGNSSLIGILLVAVGSAVLLFSFIRYKKTEKQLANDSYQSSPVLILLLTIIIVVISILLIVYLIENTKMY
jgi:putative membrane protein